MSIDFKKSLFCNFESIQKRINEINNKQKIDIKEISDLQRYVEMQRCIIDSIYTVNTYECD